MIEQPRQSKCDRAKGIQVALRLCPPQSGTGPEETIVWEKGLNGMLALVSNCSNELSCGFSGRPRQNFHSQSMLHKETPENDGSQSVAFNFDHCFSMAETNQRVYEESVRDMALNVTKGINSSVIMYGQTGSGKTFTMHGAGVAAKLSENRFGVMQLGVADVFSIIHHQSHLFRLNAPHANQTLKSSTKDRKSAEIQKPYCTFGMQNSKESHCSEDQTPSATFEESKEIIPDPNCLSSPCTCPLNKSQNNSFCLKCNKNSLNLSVSSSSRAFHVSCSYVEVYNDSVFDLLTTPDKVGECLSISENPVTKTFFLKKAVQETVNSIEEVCAVLKKGEVNRHYAETTMNHASSRSHTIFMLNVRSFMIPEHLETSAVLPLLLNSPEFFESANENGFSIIESTLTFVDLAGSEKVSSHTDFSSFTFDDFQTGQNPSVSPDRSMRLTSEQTQKVRRMRERVKEGQSINKSLFFLTQVVSLKSEKIPEALIPYRNSPLTKILKASIGGENSKTLLMLCMLPTLKNIENSLSTIRFGTKAKKIKTKPLRDIQNLANQEDKSPVPKRIRDKLDAYEKRIVELEKENKELKSMDKKQVLQMPHCRSLKSFGFKQRLSHDFLEPNTQDEKNTLEGLSKTNQDIGDLKAEFVFDCLSRKLNKLQKEKRQTDNENKTLNGVIKSLNGDIRHLHGEILTGGISKISKETGNSKRAVVCLQILESFKEESQSGSLKDFEDFLVKIAGQREDHPEEYRSRNPTYSSAKRGGQKEGQEQSDKKSRDQKKMISETHQEKTPRQTGKPKDLVRPIEKTEIETTDWGKRDKNARSSQSPAPKRERNQVTNQRNQTPVKASSKVPPKTAQIEKKQSKSPISSHKKLQQEHIGTSTGKSLTNPGSSIKKQNKGERLKENGSDLKAKEQGYKLSRIQKQLLKEKTGRSKKPGVPSPNTTEKKLNFDQENFQLQTNIEEKKKEIIQDYFQRRGLLIEKDFPGDFQSTPKNDEKGLCFLNTINQKSPILRESTTHVLNAVRKTLRRDQFDEFEYFLGKDKSEKDQGYLGEDERKNLNLYFSDLDISGCENARSSIENGLKMDNSGSSLNSMFQKLETKNVELQRGEEPIFSFRCNQFS